MIYKEKEIPYSGLFYLADADCVEDGGKYMLVHDMHGYLIQGNNKNMLWRWIESPEAWCAGCRGEDPRFDNYDDTKVVA